MLQADVSLAKYGYGSIRGSVDHARFGAARLFRFFAPARHARACHLAHFIQPAG